jgi:ribosomal protein S18 acetylase RimI-like enzyme
VGLFDIVTRQDRRGRRLASRIIRHLLHIGAEMGATMAYLQVMLDNGPALRLYQRLGFTQAYQYWYRVAG